MAKKGAKGGGTIRKKTVTRGGKEYTYWEARITTGREPGTGKQIQRSFTGKTQKEVREKLQAAALLKAAKGSRIEHLISLALFTGFRLSELLGLTWDSVDFDQGSITINKQLSAAFMKETLFTTPKSGKPRTVTPAASAFDALRRQKVRQTEQQLKAGPLWANPYGLIFTLEDGGPISQQSAENDFAAIRAAAGLEGFRFHDLRHTYAVNSIRAGGDIKTIQGNLGHASAAFTLDVYGHVTEAMRQESASRMETFIKGVMKL